MSDEIIKVLDDLSKRAGIAIDWTSQNVLPYYKNYVINTLVMKYGLPLYISSFV